MYNDDEHGFGYAEERRFANKGLGGINLGNILHHKFNKSKIPPYFKAQSVPII
jgi:hypothetical protein